MSGQLFQKVENLAQHMLDAATADDEVAFYLLYDELNTLCEEAKSTSKDHPVLWETLGDFSEVFVDAMVAYEHAFILASKMKDNEYKASIQYAMAQRYTEEGMSDKAVQTLEQADKFASFTEDTELQDEIKALLSEVKAS